ncbi:hypothetical protein NLU13_2305 [Sarocladium strictum]|uniref:Ubiquitin carboxyl-terminal hydrolase n=1 Tax=Sarocladium strictum TaxID=5046 RepID=A0AA39LD60_SARSR|nr:hypothetical protein NLU13_2305 [Sarocladium strictum]
MPERPAVVSYAAGASLAAVALIYVFGPTFTLDGAEGTSSKKKTIVGLRNQANDCFINSVLQSLAGLPDLRLYLIRETHRRRIEDPKVYTNIVPPGEDDVGGSVRQMPQWKLQGMQEGLVTQGLKEMLDALNERPIAKKSISPHPFIRVLEVAFKQRISRQQQDAQEFLQIVAERLKDEYHAGQRARAQARRLGLTPGTQVDTNTTASPRISTPDIALLPEEKQSDGEDSGNDLAASTTATDTTLATSASASTEKVQIPLELEEGFPMEGRYESQIECQTCRYKTKPREESFCTLTLAVPQVSSTTLSACFDGIFKTEYIDEFKCEMCRLVQTATNLEHEIDRSTSESFREATRAKLERLRTAIETDPENPPEDIELGDIRYAPKRKIAKTTRLTVFPKVLAVHLSRSIYGAGAITQKNMARVSFPERLPMGSLADQRKYKLLGTVSHKGGHNSGHYEAFRRQNPPPRPFLHGNTFQRSDVYSRTPTPAGTPVISAMNGTAGSPAVSTPDLLSASSGDSFSAISVDSATTTGVAPTSAPRSVPRDPETSSLRSVAASTKSAFSRLASPKSESNNGYLTAPVRASTPRNGSPSPASPASSAKAAKPRPRKRQSDKWWRVSDEKVREAKTSEVLGMQKEVYLLFYELERGEDA